MFILNKNYQKNKLGNKEIKVLLKILWIFESPQPCLTLMKYIMPYECKIKIENQHLHYCMV